MKYDPILKRSQNEAAALSAMTTPTVEPDKEPGLPEEAIRRIAVIKKKLGPKVYKNVQNYSVHAFFEFAIKDLNINNSAEAKNLWSKFLKDRDSDKPTPVYSTKYLSSLWTAKVWSQYPVILDNALLIYKKYEGVFEDLREHKEGLLTTDPNANLSAEDTLPGSALDTTVTLRLNLGLILKQTVQVHLISLT